MLSTPGTSLQTASMPAAFAALAVSSPMHTAVNPLAIPSVISKNPLTVEALVKVTKFTRPSLKRAQARSRTGGVGAVRVS